MNLRKPTIIEVANGTHTIYTPEIVYDNFGQTINSGTFTSPDWRLVVYKYDDKLSYKYDYLCVSKKFR